MRYLITHTLSNEERKDYENKGLYCYDLRDCDFGNGIASIEKRVLVNRVGSMITDKQIIMGEKDPDNFVDYDDFVLHNKMVGKVEDLLLRKNMTRNSER